ncbi:putative atp-dependent rna helicase chl1 protein [Botrytis fragariae]|uniref:ATP-dependent DNA helicase CHL1 n=1 Tax=Botrytis fragariae TaxID=1964551 RepID=A0A8H6EFU8_9HELO|nr:putative atp-dependent rna helicase chl1 protein [Botrytis fragariae]KAF5870722.1 putative atp-dependent rna helicase chl1 protein [Botrytis fragariae]
MDLSTTASEMDTEIEIHNRKRDFHHPYTPYPIQETFMQTVWDVLEEGKIGILESPTGTGKSLSLICGGVTWLRGWKGRVLEGVVEENGGGGGNGGEGLTGSSEPEWVIQAARERRKRELVSRREEMERRLERIRERERKERDRMAGKGDGRSGKRRKIGGDGDGNANGESAGGNEDEFLLEDWDSDGEAGGGGKKGTGDETIFSRETLELKKSVGLWSKGVEDEDEEPDDEMKIFYCSRTHSQLTQFINELRRVEFPPSIPPSDEKKEPLHEHLKHLTLGSRKNLCINPKVNKLNSVTAINERCAELQQSSTPKEQKCPHLPNQDNKPLVNTFRDHTLATIRDIEDMGSLGKEISICPYYASRAAIKPAEIVTLPYPLLLQKSAREALGISLKGHVVIIDEAHNLMDAIAGIYGTEMELGELRLAKEMLGNYFRKFAKRLGGKNRIYVAQTIRVVDSLVGYLVRMLEGSERDGVVSQKDLLSGKGADQIDLFKLIRYLQESKLARKVESYTDHIRTSQPQPQTSVSSSKLKDPPSQLFFLKHENDITLKFQLLNPAIHFDSIVSSARAVILAGGTMSPFSDYTSILFPSIPPHKITTLSCGHVIPSSNLFASVVSKGPTGYPFKWTYENRANAEMMDELGRVLVNVCTVVPGGVVVFFPSYRVLDTILARFAVFHQNNNNNGNSISKPKSILQRLEEKKTVVREAKEDSVEEILRRYGKAIEEGKGGLLFSVVGGKLSEGINFSDELGRAVVIVGLPFPNARTAEWRRRLRFVEESAVKRLSGDYSISSPLTGWGDGENKNGNGNGETGGKEGNMETEIHIPKEIKEEIQRKAKEEAKEFFENVCMRAVNQSVGRAIRHKGDWAGILMVDERFRGRG